MPSRLADGVVLEFMLPRILRTPRERGYMYKYTFRAVNVRPGIIGYGGVVGYKVYGG